MIYYRDKAARTHNTHTEMRQKGGDVGGGGGNRILYILQYIADGFLYILSIFHYFRYMQSKKKKLFVTEQRSKSRLTTFSEFIFDSSNFSRNFNKPLELTIFV